MGGFQRYFRSFRKSCQNFLGFANNSISGDIVLLCVAVVLIISLLFKPFLLTALALLGLIVWALFY